MNKGGVSAERPPSPKNLLEYIGRQDPRLVWFAANAMRLADFLHPPS